MTPLPLSQTKELLADLVGFDTTSAKSNLLLIDYLKAYLDRNHVASTIIPAPDGQPKACLVARIGEGEGGVGLSGHTDCVPVTDQSWTSDPFTLTERDGRLYGRGTADMKGFLACMLAMVPAFRATRLARPIDLLFSYDEEVGCRGVRPMIDAFGARVPGPAMVIVGEPTSMTVVDAHKGPNRFNVTVTGQEAHSSMAHLGVNAIQVAARLIAELERIEADLRERHRSARFTPPYSTIQVGGISGGTAPNIVPRQCFFTWEVRALPGLDGTSVRDRLADFAERALLPSMRKIAPQAGIVIDTVNAGPPFEAGRGSEVVSLVMRLAGQNETYAVAYGTEASFFQDAGYPSVICGPGDIAQAHAADEYIEIAELERCLTFLDRLRVWARG
jgi:acetylornithine deacetylase